MCVWRRNRPAFETDSYQDPEFFWNAVFLKTFCAAVPVFIRCGPRCDFGATDAGACSGKVA